MNASDADPEGPDAHLRATAATPSHAPGAPPTRHDAPGASALEPPVTSAPAAEVTTQVVRARDYTSAVYGSVLAATVIVSSGDLRAPLVLAVLLVVSGLVFWIAHVYAATVASVHGGWRLGAIEKGLRHEWPVAFAAIPPAVAALVCALLPDVTVAGGVWVALIVAIGEQQLWGYAAVRNAGLTGVALTKTLLLNVVMGFIIVALKLGIGH